MTNNLSSEEVAAVIKARKILKERGLPPYTDVTTICRAAGISRKTGYQWANKLKTSPDSQDESLRKEHEQLKKAHEDLKKRFDDVQFENEGRKLAWEIHGVDELLAKKKALWLGRKRKSGKLFSLYQPSDARDRMGAICFNQHREWLASRL